jgi:hypothetical protein
MSKVPCGVRLKKTEVCPQLSLSQLVLAGKGAGIVRGGSRALKDDSYCTIEYRRLDDKWRCFPPVLDIIKAP